MENPNRYKYKIDKLLPEAIENLPPGFQHFTHTVVDTENPGEFSPLGKKMILCEEYVAEWFLLKLQDGQRIEAFLEEIRSIVGPIPREKS